MSDFEVERKPRDEHVSLQPDLVHGGRREGDGQADEAHDGGGGLLGVGVGVLGPQLTQQQHHSVAAGLKLFYGAVIMRIMQTWPFRNAARRVRPVRAVLREFMESQTNLEMAAAFC